MCVDVGFAQEQHPDLVADRTGVNLRCVKLGGEARHPGGRVAAADGDARVRRQGSITAHGCAEALEPRGLHALGAHAPQEPAAGLEGLGSAVRGDGALPANTRIAVSRSHTPTWMPRFAAELHATQVHSGSVGNKVAMLLLGEADVYAHRKGLKEWDTCAPEVVARALGWRVSRLNGEDLRYNQPDPRVDEFLVCRAAQRGAVLGALRTAGVVLP